MRSILFLSALAPLTLAACESYANSRAEPVANPSAQVERTELERELDYPTYNRGTILDEAEGVFGEASAEIAELIADIFEDEGRPQGYIAGEEVGGAIGVGVTYGKGMLYRPGQPPVEVFWQGPSLGFDVGADASKVFTLVYDLGPTANLFQRFPGGDGNAFLVGGVGAKVLSTGNETVIPIRAGVGARTGVNVNYMHFSDDRNWIPF